MRDYHIGVCNYKRKAIANDYDFWHINSGREGVGKSTFSLEDAIYTSWEDIKKNWKERITYDPEDFIAMTEVSPPGATIIMDEGGECWFLRDFQTQANKALAKVSMQIRERNFNIIINVPNIWYLDKIAIYRHSLWTMIKARGLKRGYTEFYVPEWKIFEKNPIPFWEIGVDHIFPKLPKRLYDEYKILKSEKASERLGKYLDQIQKEKEHGTFNKDNRNMNDLIKEAHSIDQRLLTNKNGKYLATNVQFHLKTSVNKAKAIAVGLNSLKI